MKNKVISVLSVSKLSRKELGLLIEVPRNSLMGDFAFPCFSLSKKFKKKPAEIAKDFVSKIGKDKNFEKIEAIGPYINFFLDRKIFSKEIIKKIFDENDTYGCGKSESKKVMIEFSQPNTHKAFHIGHIRGTSIGESLSRIIEFKGNKVIRANYSGDTGMHIAKWLWNYTKYHKKEELINNESWIAGIYVDAIKRLAKNKKLQDEVDEINRKLDARSDKELNKLWKKTKNMSIKSWEIIYHELNTRFDVHFFEGEMEERGKKISRELMRRKLAKMSDGAVIMDLKDYGLSVWVLLRGDGTVLYSAKDLALAERKFKEFNINRSIVITASEQDLHFKQLSKTLELMGFKHAKDYKHASYGMVRFPGGKMSSRTGDNVIYSDFRKEIVDYAVKQIEKRFKLETIKLYDRALAIAIASIKYSMLKQDMNKNIIFNKKEALKFEGDTGPYLLYSYARARSILRKVDYKKQKKLEIKKVGDHEKRLVSDMARFPDVVQHAYKNLAPNLVANYAYELAKTFNEFYHSAQVIGSKEEQFRLGLVDAFSQTMKNALWLMGIPVIEEM